MLFDLHEAAANRVSSAQRRNTTTGASAASAMESLTVSRAHGLGGLDPAFTSTEDLNYKENLEQDLGDDNSNDLLLSCPHFRNEIGGECERNVSFSRASTASSGRSECRLAEPSLSTYRTNASISVLEVPKEQQRTQSRPQQYSIEHVDLGARYYQDYFVGKGDWGRRAGGGLSLRLPCSFTHCVLGTMSEQSCEDLVSKRQDTGLARQNLELCEAIDRHSLSKYVPGSPCQHSLEPGDTVLAS